MKLLKIGGFDVIDFDTMKWANAILLPEISNLESLGGFNDWVLPDAQTLRALALFEPEGPGFWSSSTDKQWCGDCALVVGFKSGTIASIFKTMDHGVRLVRASQLLDINIAGAKISMIDADLILPQS